MPWGWDYSGSSNLEELQHLLEEHIMIRYVMWCLVSMAYDVWYLVNVDIKSEYLCLSCVPRKNLCRYSYRSGILCWLGGVMVTVLDLQSRGHRFNSQPFHYQVMTLIKLFTYMCLCRHYQAVYADYTIQYNSIKSFVSCTVVDCWVEFEAQAVAGWAEVVIMELSLF